MAGKAPSQVAVAVALAAAFAVLAATAALLWPHFQHSSLENGAGSHPLDAIGGPFSLVDQRGEPVTERTFQGKPTLYFFGFTHCPDVCPTALFEMTERLRELGPDGDRINVVFVSVDPERDTPAQLALYLQSFDPRITGLSGTREAVDAIVKAYKIFVRRVPLEGGDYTLDHTASTFGADAKGRVRLLIGHSEERASALGKIRRLIVLSEGKAGG